MNSDNNCFYLLAEPVIDFNIILYFLVIQYLYAFISLIAIRHHVTLLIYSLYIDNLNNTAILYT